LEIYPKSFYLFYGVHSGFCTTQRPHFLIKNNLIKTAYCGARTRDHMVKSQALYQTELNKLLHLKCKNFILYMKRKKPNMGTAISQEVNQREQQHVRKFQGRVKNSPHALGHRRNDRRHVEYDHDGNLVIRCGRGYHYHPNHELADTMGCMKNSDM
jgi:hypothetical protein